ncbi:Uma2 family endonuclease [Allorhodopirellula solitaria]|nr:Uma2 family endonuclease [Allorhodopirellula solitaria]
MTHREYQVAEGLAPYTELIHGKVVELNAPSRLHGLVCAEIAFLLTAHSKKHDCGAVFTNDSGILVQRSPDTVRGMDVGYCSYQRVAKGQLPEGYGGPAPEVVFEVLSKTDRWPAVLAKVADYLQADVLVVCVVDPGQRTARMFRPDGTDITLSENDTLEIPEIQPTLEAKVSDIFSS